MITVFLYGGLEKVVGVESFQADLRCPGEAFSALAAQCKGFVDHIIHSAQNGLGYEVIADDEAIDESGLELPVFSTVSIAPTVAGSGDVTRIILGTVLLAGAFLIPGGALGLTALQMGQIGALPILGGISGLLSPTPSNNDNQNSFLLDANGQPRSYQGEAIPVLFGDWWIENPPIISLWVDVENIPVNWSAT